VLLSAVLVGGVIWLMRSQEGNMRLAIAELAAVPLAFGIWLGACLLYTSPSPRD